MPTPFDWDKIKEMNTESAEKPKLGETLSADTDLFFLAWTSTAISQAPRGDAWLIVYNPVGKVHTASTSVQQNGARTVPRGSVFTPVRKGDKFAAVFKENEYLFEGCTLPVNLEFGSWEWLEIDKVYGPQQQDGFVAVSLHGQPQGTKYALKGLQSVPGSSVMDTFAAATLHMEEGGGLLGAIEGAGAHIWAQGFCMPVPKGNSFKLEHEYLYGTAPEIRPFWLPIVGETYRFGPQKLVTDTYERAPYDGILYGYVEARASGSGYAQLLQGERFSCAASVQSTKELVATRQSITTPVRAHSSFCHWLGSSLMAPTVDGHFWYMPILGGS